MLIALYSSFNFLLDSVDLEHKLSLSKKLMPLWHVKWLKCDSFVHPWSLRTKSFITTQFLLLQDQMINKSSFCTKMTQKRKPIANNAVTVIFLVQYFDWIICVWLICAMKHTWKRDIPKSYILREVSIWEYEWWACSSHIFERNPKKIKILFCWCGPN